jgi:hypothetical protein
MVFFFLVFLLPLYSQAALQLNLYNNTVLADPVNLSQLLESFSVDLSVRIRSVSYR